MGKRRAAHRFAARWRVALCLPTLLLLVAFPALAQNADRQIAGKRVALVVGMGGYKNVERLANADTDAKLIAATLKGLNFTLVGGGALLDLDHAHLSQAVQDFGRALDHAEVGLFYYSGHGLQVGGTNWLVPVDANPTQPSDLDFQMVDADLVLKQMNAAGTKLNLVLLDACRNNPFGLSGLRALRGGLAEMRAPEGTLISYATQPGNVAADGTGPDSPYTTALAQSMTRPGLDIFRLFNRVGLEVKRATGGNQQPWVSNSPIDGDFYFVPPAVSAPPAPPAQIATLIQPPPPPSVPAAPPSLEQPDPVALARALPCSILDATVGNGRLDLRGIAVEGQEWNGLLRALGSSRGLRLEAREVEFAPRFACDALGVLAAPVRAALDAGGARLLATHGREIAAGASANFSVRRAAGEAVTLDVFRAGDMVDHVPVPAGGESGEARVSIEVPAGSLGQRLVTAVVSPAPLALGARPTSEPATVYLAALREALAATPTARADVSVIEFRAPPPPRPSPPRPSAPQPVASAPRPPVPARPSRSSACDSILERAQLGEPVTDSERAILRSQCR